MRPKPKFDDEQEVTWTRHTDSRTNVYGPGPYTVHGAIWVPQNGSWYYELRDPSGVIFREMFHEDDLTEA